MSRDADSSSWAINGQGCCEGSTIIQHQALISKVVMMLVMMSKIMMMI